MTVTAMPASPSRRFPHQQAPARVGGGWVRCVPAAMHPALSSREEARRVMDDEDDNEVRGYD